MSEIKVIKDIQAWDKEAFWKLYEDYIEKIYNFIYLKTYNTEIAEDLTSEVFYSVLNKINTYKEVKWASFSSWVYKIAYNKVVDYYKSKKEDLSLDIIYENWYEEDLWTRVDNNSKIREVYDFINTLKQEHKEILIMRLWDNLSYNEISEITWKSVDNCKKIFSRNLKKINENITVAILVLLFI